MSLDIVSMLKELKAAGVQLDLATQPDPECCYNYIIHQYDITFLANKWEFVSESRNYKPRGIRISSGTYRGKFPPNAPKEK